MAGTRTKDDRVSRMEEGFGLAEEAPSAQVPATIQQVMIDDRPTGALDVKVRRDLKKVMQDIKTIATAAGEDFFYSWPTKNKDGTTGTVEGPSVKCANAVSRIYGNCVVQVRAFDQGPHWIIYARFVDLETGYVYERPFQQRKNQNVGGKMDKDRALDVVFQIGVSKAARNAVCNALSEFTDYAFEIAKAKIVETIGKDIERYRAKVLERLAELDVDPSRVEAVRGKTRDKWLAQDLAKIIAELQGVGDGMAHPDELWPPIEAGAPRPKPEDFKEGGEVKAPAAGTEGKETSVAAKEPAPPAGDTKPATEQAQGAPQPAAQPTAASEAPKAEGSAEPRPQAPAEPEGPKPAEEAKQEPPTDEPAVDPAALKAAEAFEQAERYLSHQVDQANDARDVAALDELDKVVREQLAAFADMDPEDRSVLQGRWNTAVLERKRVLSRRRPK